MRIIKSLMPLMALAMPVVALADTITVNDVRHAGPFALVAPWQVDSLGLDGKPYTKSSLLATPVSLTLVDKAPLTAIAPIDSTATPSLHLISFTLDNSRYAKASLKVDGLKNYETYIDGVKTGPSLSLTPGTRRVVIKCLTDSTDGADSLKLSLVTDTPQWFEINPTHGRRFTMCDMFEGQFLGGPSLSPSGKYLVITRRNVEADGKTSWTYQLYETAGGRLLDESATALSWMPSSDRLYTTRVRQGRNQLVAIDPATLAETVLAADMPDVRQFVISPTEDFIIFSRSADGPKEKNAGLYQIINPEDRQPGWRNRSDLYRHDFATGITSRLTFGNRGAHYAGLSADGKKLLFTVGETAMGKRPTSFNSVYLLDLPTMQATQLVDKDGFLGGASLSPDGKSVALVGSPESFGGIGNNLPDSVTPNMIENELYIMDIASREIRPVSRDFDPSIDRISWSRADGQLYFTAEDRDYKPLYRLDPASGKISRLDLPEDIITSYSLASAAPMLAFGGQGPDHPTRIYTMDTRKGRPVLKASVDEERLADLNLTPTVDWSFVSTTFGDTIHARYTLPADFDPSRKYPVIVYYYGGCSPVARNYDATYNSHLWSANGYIGLTINPSGAVGRGQEFASRHVATAGEGVAQDIIDGVKAFLAEHPFADASKVGCHGASYGGFMTQYLLTHSDVFATGISHAGISDHTSYWGQGYWGYSYSQASMGDKLPWADTELYVKQSPLYNADHLSGSLLLLHGDSDNNVPFSESVQMFTALKLLGAETALVAVKGQDHHILDWDKRKRWLDTMFAWFARYLQDDPSWWNSMYDTGVLE